MCLSEASARLSFPLPFSPSLQNECDRGNEKADARLPNLVLEREGGSRGHREETVRASSPAQVLGFCSEARLSSVGRPV